MPSTHGQSMGSPWGTSLGTPRRALEVLAVLGSGAFQKWIWECGACCCPCCVVFFSCAFLGAQPCRPNISAERGFYAMPLQHPLSRGQPSARDSSRCMS